MKRLKKLCALMFAVVLCITFVGCGRKETSSVYYVEEEVEEQDTNQNQTENPTDGTTTSSKSTKTKNKKSGTQNGDIWKIQRDVVQGGSGNILNGLNLGGKTFRMLVWQEDYTPENAAQIKEFANKYNCKITVEQCNFEDVLTTLATQLSAGKPYDIVKIHGAFMPQVAISNLLQPIENTVSKNDCITSSNKVGLDWNKMYLNTTWGNHVYYTVAYRGTNLPVMIYNKLLFNDYGLEDAFSLYSKGQWTWEKLAEYAKIVSNAGTNVKFYDTSVSDAAGGGKDVHTNFYTISDDGKITWNGANTKLANLYKTRRDYYNLSKQDGSAALVDNITAGKIMLQLIEAEKLPVYANALKGSAAFGKSLNNVGVVPIPYYSDGSYKGVDCVGYGSCRGTDPKVAVALSVFLSSKEPSWTKSGIPAMDSQKAEFDKLYAHINPSGMYYFLNASGQRIQEVIYPMYGEIRDGGDIMKLLESYAPKAKAIVEYNLEKQ